MIFVYIIIGVIVLYIFFQYSMIFAAKRTRGNRITGLTDRLKSLEKKDVTGLVYFFSPTCSACKSQTPIINSLQKDYKNVFDVDISKDLETSRIFGVKATPTTVLVKNGVIDKVFLGVKQKKFIGKYLENK